MSWYLVTSGSSGEVINFTDGDLSGSADIPKVIHITEASKDLTYTDGNLTLLADLYGTKTFNYSSGILTSITGTGKYQSKILHYTNNILTSIEVL